MQTITKTLFLVTLLLSLTASPLCYSSVTIKKGEYSICATPANGNSGAQVIFNFRSRSQLVVLLDPTPLKGIKKSIVFGKPQKLTFRVIEDYMGTGFFQVKVTNVIDCLREEVTTMILNDFRIPAKNDF